MAEIIQSSETSFSAAAPQDDSSAVPEAPPLEFNTTFQGQKLTLRVKRDGVVADLKAAITDETQVPAKRQKLIGLVKGALPPDESRLAELVGPRGETPPTKFLLMGTPDDKLFVDPKDRDDLHEVVNDLAPDFDYQGLCDEWHRSRRHAATLSKFTAKTEINWLTPRRKGKKLLVLDLDHTLLDFNRHDAPTDVSANSKRPGMDAFLEAVYEDYDFVIWSQTHWRWLELKLTALGMLASPKYKICFVMDKTSMFRIVSKKKDGTEFKHAIKPLRIIWDKVEGWNAANTLHLDDLSRNFALNPRSGVKCRAYHRDKPDASSDVELPALAAYLAHVARCPKGLSSFDHGKWRAVWKQIRKEG